MAGKTYIKTGSSTWDKVKKIYLKTGGQTWTAVRKAYIKTGSSTWKKVYDTASNKPYLKNNDRPRLRLNSYRSSGFIEAEPVQQMGPPTTNPTTGWPNGTVGDYLWGANADDLNNWVSGNGSTITYTYKWFYNYTGNLNDNIEETAQTSSSWGDRLTNSSTYLGKSLNGIPGGYFDRNFLIFRVRANNSAGPTDADSNQVYIVKQKPTGTLTMIDPDIATPNTTMAASFSISNNWYKTVEQDKSYIEWFAVDNLGDTLTTSNRVQIEYLDTFYYPEDAETATSLTSTSYHVPTLTNKYYYARITLNNSNTLPAEFNGTTINVSGFTPNSAQTYSANKTSKTASANGPFNLTNATKTIRYYDTNTSTWKRNVSVDIGQSSSATQYEVQVEGQYAGTQGTYDYTSSAWVVLQSLAAAPYIYETSRIGGTLTYSYTAGNYLNYRFTARSRNGTSLNGAAYSNNGTSSSYVYVTAPAVAPSAPVISNIATSSDYFGSYITFDISVSSYGSNDWRYFEYTLDNGSNWLQSSANSGYINTTSGKLYATAGQSVNLRIRLTNEDIITGPQSNLLSITAASVPGTPTSVVAKSFVNKQGIIFFTSGSNTQSVQGYFEFDTFNTFDSIQNYVNVSSNTAAKVQITGAVSSSTAYTYLLRPYSGQNQTGGTGTTTSFGTKVLNGSDNMVISVGTPTRPSDRTISLSWTLSSGAPTHYICRLYNFTTGSIISTKTVASTTTSISFNSSDGVQYSTVYYIGVQPQYQYTASVTYEDGNFVSSNINSGANLTAPTSTFISSVSRLNDTTCRVLVGSSGGSGPYYQLYWVSSSTAPTTASYDAAGTSSTVTEDYSFASGITYYFYMRSSNENLGNTINSGTATDGTYSAYGPSTGAASYTFAVPTSATASISGSTSVGSTLTLTTSVTGGSPTPVASIIWRRADGGTGGNSFTGGSIMQTGGTTYVIDSPLVAYSSVGYSIRAEVTYNNGLTTNVTANSNSIVVTSNAPGTPTSLTATTTRTDGVNLTFSGSSGASSYDIFWNTSASSTPSSAATPDFSGVSSPYLDTTISSGATRWYWVRGKNSSGVTSAWYPATNGVTGTRATAVTYYTVTWNANGGSVSPSSFTQSSGNLSTTAPTPTRSGYTFNGWYNASSGGTYIVGAGGSYTPTSNITLYAQWTSSSCTCSYTDQGTYYYSPGCCTPTTLSGLPTVYNSGNNVCTNCYTTADAGSCCNNINKRYTKCSANDVSSSSSPVYFYCYSTGQCINSAQGAGGSC